MNEKKHKGNTLSWNVGTLAMINQPYLMWRSWASSENDIDHCLGNGVTRSICIIIGLEIETSALREQGCCIVTSTGVIDWINADALIKLQ